MKKEKAIELIKAGTHAIETCKELMEKFNIKSEEL